jgi:chemotaxis protein MotA
MLPSLPADPTARRAVLAAGGLGLVTLVAVLTHLLDPWSLLVTVGGALAVGRATFPAERFVAAWAHLRAALAPDPDPAPLVASLKRLARIQRVDGIPALERAAAREEDDFLRHALAIGVDADDPALANELLVLEARRETAAIEASRQLLVTFGKLFPAFGLIGTLFGLVVLLRNLAGGDLGAIAPGLGLAVQTTLYGAVLANVVALPLATRLHGYAVRRGRRLQMTVDGVLLVLRGEYGGHIERVLRAHLDTDSTRTPHVGALRLAERAA